jgi:hypothetical protein
MLFPPGTQFQLPELSRPIPVRLHPHAALAEAESNRWVRRILEPVFASERELRLVVEGRGAYWSCLSFPTVLQERIAPLCDLAQYLFAFDSDFTNAMGSQGMSTSMENALDDLYSIMDGGTAHTGSAYHTAFADLWTRFVKVMRPQQQKRFITACHLYFDAQLREVTSRENNVVFDYETYLALHCHSIAVPPYLIQIEYGLGIDLSEIIDRKEIQSIHKTAGRHLTLVNDLFSFPLECSHDDYVNA